MLIWPSVLIYVFSSLGYIPSNDTGSYNQSYIFYKLFSDIPGPLGECSPSSPDAPVLTCLASLSVLQDLATVGCTVVPGIHSAVGLETSLDVHLFLLHLVPFSSNPSLIGFSSREAFSQLSGEVRLPFPHCNCTAYIFLLLSTCHNFTFHLGFLTRCPSLLMVL